MTYAETLHFLYHSLPVFQHIGGNAYKPGFGNITELEKELGEPHRRFRSVHVAGTNGKGSVSHMTAAVLQAAGYRFLYPDYRAAFEALWQDGNWADGEPRSAMRA